MSNYKCKENFMNRKDTLSMKKLEAKGKFLCLRLKYGVKPWQCVMMYEGNEEACHKGSDCSMYAVMKERVK